MAKSSSSAPAAAASLLLLLAISMAHLVSFSSAQPNCGPITNKFVPCFSYLIGVASSPGLGCCNNIRALNNQLVGPARVTACECIKKNAASFNNLRQDRAAALPGVCNVPISINISPNTDCSRA